MTSSPYAAAKRFRFTGLAEFTYRDYSTSWSYRGKEWKNDWASFEQRYRIGLQGYVYHPKFISFLTSVTYRKDDADTDAGGSFDAKDVSYDFSASFLATTPVSMDIHLSKTDATIEGIGTAPYEVTSNYYAAALNVTLRKYPSVRLEYSHWDYTVDRLKGYRVMDDWYWYGEGGGLVVEKKRVKEKTDIDKFSLHVKGQLKSIHTSYHITGHLIEYASPFRSYSGTDVTVNTYTSLKKQNTISTYFRYYDIDILKLTRFAANADLAPIGRLRHSYGYEYFMSENERTRKVSGFVFPETRRTDSHTVSTHVLYRLSKLVFGTGRLRYRTGTWDERNVNSYEVNAAFYYGRYIRNYDFTSYYKFNAGKENREGRYEYLENAIGAGVSTRKFAWGRIYAQYDLSFRNYRYAYTKRVYRYWDEFSEYDDEWYGYEYDDEGAVP